MTRTGAGLACPHDRSPLRREGDALLCPKGHSYRLIEGIPILLVEGEHPTHRAYCASLEKDTEPAKIDDEAIDPTVQEMIGATCGRLYRHLIGRLPSYPIPELRLPPGRGQLFLDVGCGWGRWCVAAARRGYRPTGVDPSLKAIRAARRIAEELGVEARYVVGDARHLPFPNQSFDVVFSYSVLQHFARADAVSAFAEIARVLGPGGTSLLQLANLWGVRSLFNQARERRFREPRALFDVRYWGPRELKRTLERQVGPTRLEVDGFFTLNPQPGDLALLPRRYRAVVRASEALRRASAVARPLTYGADSLFARSELRSRLAADEQERAAERK